MKKKILFIGTGGTIASEISDEGIHPNIDAEMLLSYAPKIREICDVDCVSLYNLDSSNLTPRHWVGIAKEIEENFDNNNVKHSHELLIIGKKYEN